MLVAIATIALAGWGVILSTHSTTSRPPAFYGIAFSAVLGHGFSLVYGMLTAHDILILQLEARLGKSAASPFLDYYLEAYGGIGGAGLWMWLYRATAFSIPFLAVVVIMNLVGTSGCREAEASRVVAATLAICMLIAGAAVNEVQLRRLRSNIAMQRRPA